MTNWRWDSRPGSAGPHGGAVRPVMMGRVGAVASASPLASLIGLDVLRDGGNAFDAAVAVSSVVPLGEPYMSGIGGLGMATMYHAASDTCISLEFEGAIPAALRSGDRPTGELSGLPSAWVPGLVAGWGALLERYGTMDLDRLLRPAIERARRGVPVSVMLNSVIEGIGLGTGHHTVLKPDGFKTDLRVKDLFMPGGRPLPPGDLLIQERLAATLDTIAREGATAFYRGSIAQDIARASAAAGGYITLADLAAYEPKWGPPLHVGYRGHQVNSVPWPAAGPQLLETLSLLDGSDLEARELDSADGIHTFIESVKIAQADRVAQLGANDFDPSGLLERAYAERRRAEIDPGRATPGPGDERPQASPVPAPAGAETSHFVVADANGNLVSLTQTIGNHFGSAAIVGDTGALLNNLTKFPQRGLPMAPSIVMDRSGAPWMAVGSVGGPGIPQTIAQMIGNVVDLGLNPQAALEAPRFRVFKDHRVMMETRIPEPIRTDLARRGHECDLVGEWAYGEGQLGRGQMILRDRSGSLFAASDPRADGAAQAF